MRVMAFLMKKNTKYSTYYVIAESKRVDGKPRIVNQIYLGTVESIMDLVQKKETQDTPREVQIYEHGAVAALFQIAEEIGIRSLINGKIKKQAQGMTPGDYILISALNRAIDATSKSKIGEWVESTTLPHLMNINKSKLSSQNFWDHFSTMSSESIEQIGDEIAKRVVEVENINLDCLVYDTTNYFNYWDVTNPSELSRMTKSKDGKDYLRHIGLTLTVDRDHGIPLFHRVYPANWHDSKVFSNMLDSIYRQISSLVNDKKGITLIFDKGNNSQTIIESLDESRHHFIGARSPYHHKELCRKDISNFREISLDDGQTILAFETSEDLYGKPRRIIVTYNESNYQRQLYRMEKNIEKVKEEISSFKRKVKGVDGRSTIDSIHRNAQEILQRYHVAGLVEIEVEENENGYKVSARKNFLAVEDTKTRFGKHILFTNRETLTIQEIIQAYRDRYVVEECFKITKSDHWVKWDPAFHWTDSKIRVHALTCVIALILVKIAYKRVKQVGFEYGLPRMMELLSGIKSSILLYPNSSKAKRKLCSLSEEQRVLMTSLNIPELS